MLQTNEEVQAFKGAASQRLHRSWQWHLASGQTAAVQCCVPVDRPYTPALYQPVLDALSQAQPIIRSSADNVDAVDCAARAVPLLVHDESGCFDLTSDALSQRYALAQLARIEEDYAARAAAPLKIDLIVMPGDRHLILLAAPAWCADLVSLRLIADCLIRQSLPEPDSALSYQELLLLQRELQLSPDHAVERSYWLEQQGDWTAYRCEPQPRKLAELALAWPTGNAAAITEADEASLLACWQHLLERQFGTAAVISCAVSPREIVGLEATIGPLTFGVPLKLSSGSVGLSRARLDVREQLQAASANCLFFEDPDSDGSGLASGWRFGFDFAANLGVCAVLRDDREWHSLRLSVMGQGEQRALKIVFDPAIHLAKDVHWIGQQFLHLLSKARAEPTKPLCSLGVVDPVQAEWLSAASAGPQMPTLAADFVSRLRDICATRPTALALQTGTLKLTFAEFDAWSNQIARFLQEEGVRSGDRVGLCMPRTGLQVATLVGVLKLGACYVPIDPSLPAKRIASMVAKARVAVIATDTSVMDRVSELDTEVPLIDLQRYGDDIASLSNTSFAVDIAAEQGAYLIFTSGSTGVPKAVEVSHRALMNYIGAIEQRLLISQYGSLCALSTVAADLGYTAVFGALGHGCCLRILDESLSLDAAALADELAHSPVDCLKIVPSHLQALLSIERPTRVLPRQCIIFGGEALTWDLVDRLKQLSPGLRIVNHYGPTETTVGIVCNTELDTRGAGFGAPLGRPLANCQTYVLNQDFQPCAVGEEGDLYLGGNSLSNGYFEQAPETASRFLPNPFSSLPGARLYASGDRARWNGKGELCFLGRADHQIKLRGHRIELGEIEAVIRSTAQVRDCVVVVINHGSGARLVAYAVGDSSTESAVRATLASRVPEYMCPGTWVWLERLPLNANGKLDRRALPDPDAAPRSSREAGNRIESTLLSICRELLGNERIGVDDNFFAVGADSIIAIQLVARAREVGYFFRPKQVFEQQTIARLAEVVQLQGDQTLGEQGEVHGLAPLTAIQARFFALVDIDPQQYNQACLIELDAGVQPAVVRAAISKVLAHHDGLRVSFQREADGRWQQQFHAISAVPAEHCLEQVTLHADDCETFDLAEFASQRHAGFDLTRAPLLRFVMVVDSDRARKAKLLVIAHHLLVDTFSWQVLEEDIRRLLAEPSATLPAKTVSMKQVAEQTFSELLSADRQLESAYWQSLLSRIPRLPIAPMDDRVGDACSRHLVLPVALSAALSGEVHSRFNTNTQDFLLAALLVAFSQWCGSDSVGVMLEGHGRDDDSMPNCDRTIGWFTSMFPLLLSLPEGFAEQGAGTGLIMAVKEQVRAVPRQGAGYAQTTFLQSQGAPVSIKEPEICFNYLGRFAGEADTSRERSGADLQAVQSGTRSRRQRRLFAMEVLAMQFGEQLVCNFVYQPARISEAVMDQLASGFEKALSRLVLACSASQGTLTPSDVPDLNLEQQDLDALLSELSEVV